MVRIFYERGYGVYVNDERGAPHHRPHAHIVYKRTRVASFYLETLDFLHGEEHAPRWLREQIAASQEQLLARWKELNDEHA